MTHQNPPRSEGTSPLRNEFPIPDLAQWRSLVDKQLQGAPFEKKLISKTAEGIAVKPLYVAEDITPKPGFPGSEPYLRGFEPLPNYLRGWTVCQAITDADPRRAAEALLQEIKAGSSGVRLIFDRASQSGLDPHEAPELVGVDGVSLFNRADLEPIVSLLPPEMELVIEAGESTAAVIPYLNGRPFTAVFDPIAKALTAGALRADPAKHIEVLSQLLNEPGPLKSARIIGIDGRPYAEAGGSAVEELAFSFAALIDYVRMARGIGPDRMLSQVSLHFSVGPRLFMEIAKFRAARLIWAQLLKCYEISASDDPPLPQIHACSQKWSKTTIDPYVNMLRVTTEAFAASIGGARSITTAPFDEVIGQPDELGRRIARNTQLILQEESHLHRVIDAAGGSWYIEWLTEELATTSWALLQEVEGMGGMCAAVSKGWVQERISSTQHRRLAEIAQRRDVLVGTNQYADVHEKPVVRSAARGAPQFVAEQIEKSSSPANSSAGPSIGTVLRGLLGSGSYTLTPLNIRRAAEEYESLRRATSQFEILHGSPPAALLVGFGPMAQHKPRADFSREFLEPAGYAVTLQAGFADGASAGAAAAESKADIVVICSTDESYPELVPEFCAALRRLSSAPLIVLAGYPADHLEAFKSAGVQEFIHLRANNLETLTRFHQFLGI